MLRLTSLLLCLLPATAAATWTDEHASALDWQRYDGQWVIDGATRDVSVDALGVSVTEPYSDWLYSGLLIGFEELSIAGDPAFAGLNPNGGYLAVLLGSRLFDSEHFELNMQLGYSYHRLEDDEAGRELTGKWAVADGRLSAAVKFWRLRFSAGAYAQSVDGDLVFSGVLPETRRFESLDDGGAFGGIDFYVDNHGGRIGLQYQTGAREGYMLTFAREF